MGSLPRPKRVRLLCAPEDRPWTSRLATLIEALPEPVMVEIAAAGEHASSGTTCVILIWSHVTERNAAVFREINDWDRNGTPIHILRAEGVPVLAFLNDLASTVSVYTDEAELSRWIRVEVLDLGPDEGDGPRTEVVVRFQDAADRYRQALSDRLSLATVVGRRDKERLDSLYLQLYIADADLSYPSTDRSLVEVLTETHGGRLFVVGPAGAGKSTMLDYAALRLAKDDLGAARLPLLLRAADLVSSAYSSVTDYIQLVIKGVVPRYGKQASYVISNSEDFGGQGTVLLVDGVDELRREHRPRLRQLLRQFEIQFPDATIVLAARPSGYDRSLWFDYNIYELRPLSDEQVSDYVRRFATAAARDQLLSLLANSERIRELARTPFMLALITSFEGDAGALPIRRALLIRACVNSLLSRRPLSDTAGLSNSDLASCLRSLGMRLFKLSSAGGHREVEVLFALEQYLGERPQSATRSGRASLRDRAVLILDEVIDRTGLLQRDGDIIDFVHRSIWEYFVALALVDESLEALAGVAAIPAYEEPIRLMVGLLDHDGAVTRLRAVWRVNRGLALRSAGESPYDLDEVVGQLIRDLQDGDAAELVRSLKVSLADRTTLDAGERTITDTLGVLLPHTRSCETLWEGLTALVAIRRRRPEAGALLEQIFDTNGSGQRREQLLNATGIEFVAVPGGSFTMGSDAPGRSVDERPSHGVEVSSFNITTITTPNAARALFPFNIGLVDDPRSPTTQHPIVGVTWYEASIFAMWFGGRLPTEAEWEYACRAGGHDDAVLSAENSIPSYAWFAGNAGNTTHVPGQLLSNSLGLFDVLGNVREWCSDWFGPGYYQECAEVGIVKDPEGPADGIQKVLRGGCFDWNTANLVPTYRNSNLPNNRGFQNGFRLVWGLPIWLVEH